MFSSLVVLVWFLWGWIAYTLPASSIHSLQGQHHAIVCCNAVRCLLQLFVTQRVQTQQSTFPKQQTFWLSRRAKCLTSCLCQRTIGTICLGHGTGICLLLMLHVCIVGMYVCHVCMLAMYVPDKCSDKGCFVLSTAQRFFFPVNGPTIVGQYRMCGAEAHFENTWLHSIWNVEQLPVTSRLDFSHSRKPFSSETGGMMSFHWGYLWGRLLWDTQPCTASDIPPECNA